tara:strand:+ start:818 stop:1048 length:231 start_codon:yes stop_codon:yes gene_type:complete
MENFLQRRIDVATCWASSRISVMDSLERYEDSYAISEEFREWIVNLGQKENSLSDYVLKCPKNLNILLEKKIQDKC